jgi:Holliday junction resolvase
MGDCERGIALKMNFADRKKPFADTDLSHMVLKALAGLGRSPKDPQKFVKNLQHVDYGLSAEDECAAVLAWLGNCVMAHRLDQDGCFTPGLGEVQIPDLLVVFKKGEEQFAALIEVKCTCGLRLRWTQEYHEKLQRYANVVKLPLLLAWRCRRLGEWILVDPLAEGLVENGKIKIEKAFTHNLMCFVAGDFSVESKPGFGINFKAEFIGPKSHDKMGYTTPGKISEAFLGSRDGKHLTGLPESVVVLLLAAASERYCEESEDGLIWGYLTPETASNRSNSVSAQLLLRTLVGWSIKNDERIAWRHVQERLNEIKSKAQMEEELQEAIGEVVRYIMHIHPQTMPKFLPSGWSNLTRKSNKSSNDT